MFDVAFFPVFVTFYAQGTFDHRRVAPRRVGKQMTRRSCCRQN